MPGALAELGRRQLKKLDRLNEHRRKIAGVYDEVLSSSKFNLAYRQAGVQSSKLEYTPLRYPVLVSNPKKIHAMFKKEHIILGNWYHKYLFTDAKYLKDLNFDPKEYPGVSKVTAHIINLPTFIKVTEKDAREIGKQIKNSLD